VSPPVLTFVPSALAARLGLFRRGLARPCRIPVAVVGTQALGRTAVAVVAAAVVGTEAVVRHYYSHSLEWYCSKKWQTDSMAAAGAIEHVVDYVAVAEEASSYCQRHCWQTGMEGTSSASYHYQYCCRENRHFPQSY